MMAFFNSQGLVRRVKGKSPVTILFRGRQEANLAVLRLSRGWKRLERKTSRLAGSGIAEEWSRRADYSALSSEAGPALRDAAQEGVIDQAALIVLGERVMQRDIRIFDEPVPESGPWPWHEDWRFGQSWSPGYFRSYSHHAARALPYDVKFPWELSRMTFLQPLVQCDLLDNETFRTRFALDVLGDWERHNPLAHSVNWYPMEAAMRGISLCLVCDLSRLAGVDESGAELLMRLLAQHGEFVFRTIEVTDNAANHYIAELVALLLIGRTLRGWYPAAARWHRFAAGRLLSEIERQFLPDGVDFEKSTAYHRLVQDLFLVASIALEQSGKSIPDAFKRRLRAATRYNAAFLRPDNQCPLIGDSDDALVFMADDRAVRDHRPSLGVAALMFGDGRLKRAADTLPVAGLWFYGRDALAKWHGMVDAPSGFDGHHYFAHGGMFVARHESNYLIMDIGEVGQNGTGGHGHNDLLSFELFLNGAPLVIDPGSYLYSGDFSAHDRFRSTASHNTLMLDDEEIAAFTGPFRISNQARPFGVSVAEPEEGVSIVSAAHTGYQALPDPVIHERCIGFDRRTGSLRCTDRLKARAEHHSVRRLHFAPGVLPVLEDGRVRMEWGEECIVIRWDGLSQGRLAQSEVSPVFGRLDSALVLEMETYISGEVELNFEIFEESRGPLPLQGQDS